MSFVLYETAAIHASGNEMESLDVDVGPGRALYVACHGLAAVCEIFAGNEKKLEFTVIYICCNKAAMLLNVENLMRYVGR